MKTKPPLPPFTEESAKQKVRMAEDAWNARHPDRVVLLHTDETRWRNRAESPIGRDRHDAPFIKSHVMTPSSIATTEINADSIRIALQQYQQDNLAILLVSAWMVEAPIRMDICGEFPSFFCKTPRG